MSQKVREGNHQHIAHHGLIKLIVKDSLSHLRNPILWIDFLDMDMEVFIETQDVTLVETPTSSSGGRGGKIEEEKVGKLEEEEAAKIEE